MPKYEVDVGGKTYEVDAPDSNTAWQWANYTHTQAAPPEAKPAPFSLSDTALSAAQSALGATKSTIEGITGAGSAPGEYLEGISKKLGAQMTPERQAEQQRRSQLEKQAAETGKPLEEIAAGLGGIKEAPIQTFAQGVGSMAPTVLLSMGAGALGAAVGAPVLVAAGVGIGVKYLIGALQGAGEVKSSIYDAVKEKLESTLPPEEAKRQAIAAQDYLGKNWDTIAQGLGLGAAASGTGAEAEVLKRFSKPIAKQIAAKEGAKAAEAGFLKATGKEALGEGAQGGQQQYAENVALTREGYTTNALKGVYGATARDAAMGAIVGGAVHPFTGRAPEEAKPVVTPTPAEPGPQIAPEAPVGTQGTLFTKEDLAGVDKRKGATIEPTPVPPQTPRPPTPPAAQGEQLGLGLDFERDYADLVKERERLKQAPQTPEVKARIAELTDQVESLHEMEIGKIRAEKTLDTEAKDRFPGLTAEPTQAGLFPEIDVVRPTPEAPPAPRTAATANDAQAIQRAQDQQAQEAADAAQKEQERKGGQYRLPLRTVPESRDVGRGLTIPARPDELTMQDLEDIGFPMRSAKTWLEQNVVGKTPAEIQVLVANNPDLLLEKGTRAQILKYLTAPVPEGYKEAPRVTPITPPNKPQQQPQPRGGKPSVGVPSQPAGVQSVQPGAGVSPAAKAPTAPVGLGLAPAGQPVSTGVVPKSAPAPTLKSNAPETPTVAAKPAPAPTPAKVVETPAAPKAAEPIKSRYERLLDVSNNESIPVATRKQAEKQMDLLDDPTMNRGKADRKANEDYADRFLTRVEGLKSVAIAEGQSLDNLKDEVKNAKGVLGTALRRMVASGKVVLEDAHPSGKKIGGVYDGEKVTLYANGIPSGQSIAVALHEVGAHLGMQRLLGKKQYNAVIDRILDMVAKADGSIEADIAQRAYKRIPVSDFKRGVGRDEMVAYFVEEMAKAEVDGTLPKIGPMRVLWNQIKTAIVTSINKALGTNFGVKDFSAQDIFDIAKSSFVAESKTEVTKGEVKQMFSVSYATESLVNSLGALDAQQKSWLGKAIDGFKSNPDIDYVTKFRTQTADIAATIEQRLRTKFDGAVRDSLGKLNPMGLYRQAQDYAKMLLEYYQTGTLYKDPTTGLWMSGVGKGVRPPAEVYALIDKYAAKNGYSRDRATQIASRVLEGVRLDAMRTSNRVDGTTFTLHLKDAEINQLLAEYNADPDLRAMSKLMDEARIAMVDNMVKVGRLTKEMGDDWKKVVGYVPFDRIEDLSKNFHKVKRISGKGLAQVGKLPELKGSFERPVGNVFDNYINTLGWMVGQTLKTDATVTTLRALEDKDVGFAKFLGPSAQQKDNTVDMYVNGEIQYWELPSKYDVMAFKDLNAQKPGWLRNMGAFSNVLRKAVTVLPPFALKQVTDDVQRAILTSGVKNPGALIWMSLTNFPKLALAELRGIQHPMVKDFGVMGLTGEYDFQEGKPAISLLKDLGYKKRGRFETILHRLDGITRASDLAVRKAIYDQTLKEGGDQLLAQTRAREFINFRRRGANEFVGVMVTTIPFFNAYVQGMDVLYRAASGKDSSSSVDRAQARRLFWSRAAITFMLSSLYALGKDDEDKDYQDMDLLTRDNNWVFPGGYKLSVPGELGAIFKVIPERIVEYMRRQGTPEEQEAFEAVRTTLSYMYQQYIGRVTPIPQAIKPVIEAWANKSFLTGRALEGFHHKAMDPTERVTEQTSEIAKLAAVSDLGKAISEFSKATIGVEVSPIMVDNALRGYFGSSAAMLTMVTDSLLNPTRVDRPLHKYALLSNYLYDSVGTRRMTEFYDEREKVGKANNTLRELMKTDLDRAEKYVESHSDELQLESAVNSTLEHLQRTRAYRKFLNSVEGAKDMSKEDREAELKEVKQMEVEYVQWVREAKAELRKVQ